jgi:predicted histone-like DNA-binding protein
MSVRYKVITRVNPQNPGAPKKYYPQVQSAGKVGIREMANDAAKMSTLSPIDIAAAVEAFLEIVPGKLADGKTVEMGDFGTFRLRVHTEGSDTAEEVTSRNITKTTMTFRPGKQAQQFLDGVEYEKIK